MLHASSCVYVCVNQTAVLRSSMFDALFFGYYELPRAISRKENLSLPFIGTRASSLCALLAWRLMSVIDLAARTCVWAGTILGAMQNILVDRKDPNSRKKAVEAIHEHANKPGSTHQPCWICSCCSTWRGRSLTHVSTR
jgi:hypothetical protein